MKKINTIVFFIFVIFLLILLTGYLLSEFFYDTSVFRDKLFEGIKEEIVLKAEMVESSLSDMESDLLFLSNLSSLKKLINSTTPDEQYQAKLDLQSDFLRFTKSSREKLVYYQIRYIDETGQEIVRINFDGQVHRFIPDSELQNKKDRYYFQETIKLKEEEMFISPLDLNIENGELENRGTEENPVYMPVIRYATPVFNDGGERKGIVITNIYADSFLAKIRRTERKTGNLFLVNMGGFYLSHPDTKKEFEFMFGKESSFLKDYPTARQNIILNTEKTFLETEDRVFFFKHIYPAKNHFWVVIIALEKDKI